MLWRQAAQEAQGLQVDAREVIEGLQAQLADHAQQLEQAGQQAEAASAQAASSDAAAQAAQASAQRAQQENQRLVQSLRMATSQVGAGGPSSRARVWACLEVLYGLLWPKGRCWMHKGMLSLDGQNRVWHLLALWPCCRMRSISACYGTARCGCHVWSRYCHLGLAQMGPSATSVGQHCTRPLSPAHICLPCST